MHDTPNAPLNCCMDLDWRLKNTQCPRLKQERLTCRGMTNLLVRRNYGPGKTILLNAPGDVVPPARGGRTTLSAARLKTAQSMAEPSSARRFRPWERPCIPTYACFARGAFPASFMAPDRARWRSPPPRHRFLRSTVHGACPQGLYRQAQVGAPCTPSTLLG